ncbi:ferritin family protein [Chloroflexota bacterium]
MVTEQEKTLQALQLAIKMEIDGKEFYLKASEESSNELGKKLLKSLAAEEDIHRKVFEGIYDAIGRKNTWPRVDFQSDGGKGLRTIFARATEGKVSDIKASATELDAVQTAMAMENKTYDFYKGLSQKATYDAEKDFYDALTAQEREHHIILADYYEYLKDPAAWFVKTEHPSLDGG